MKIKKLICFDFDDTLFFTPKPEEGKHIWKSVTGVEWKYDGWWGKSESLDTKVFDIKLNDFAHKEYLKHVSDKENYVVLATGRLDSNKVSLKKEVNDILDANNLKFDGVYLNTGGDTFKFKSRLFERLIENVNADEFIMYDDRKIHIEQFAEWAKTQKCNVTIVDVINKEYIKVLNK